MEFQQHIKKTSWFKRMIYNWLFSDGKKYNTEKEKQEEHKESSQEKQIREEQEGLKKFIDEFKSQTSLNVDADKLTNAINNFQFYETKLFENQGYNDGIKGAKDKNIGSSASSRAGFIYEHTSSILAGRIQGMDTELQAKNAQLEELKADLTDEKQFNDDINFLNKKEHRSFSKSTAWFYIIVGILMMFADFPISLGISKYFIDLPINFDETFLNKIANPEILLFSLGITFLNVYYKIMYDEYINVSIIPKRKEEKESEEKQSSWATIMFIGRLAIKLAILGTLLYLLYNIGNVRNALNDLTITPSYPDFVTTQQVFYFKLTSFIGTTILLPLLSGICLSVGFSTLSNSNNLSTSNARLNVFKDQKSTLEKEITTVEAVRSMLESLRAEWLIKDLKIAGLKQLFINAYFQGYKRGHRSKFSYDIYENANSLYIDYINSSN